MYIFMNIDMYTKRAICIQGERERMGVAFVFSPYTERMNAQFSLSLSLERQRDLLLNRQLLPSLKRAMLSSEGRDSYPFFSCSKGEETLSFSFSRESYAIILSVQRERNLSPCLDIAIHSSFLFKAEK